MDGFVKNALASLFVCFPTCPMWQTAYHMYIVVFEKFRQIAVLFIGLDNRQVTSHNKILDSCSCGFFNKPAEIWVHFWSAPGQVQRVCARLAYNFQALFHGFAGHYFLSVRAGINVAVFADLVAHIAEVNLEDFQFFWL